MKKVNKFHLSLSVSPNSRSITRFDCRAAVCLPYEVWECLWSQEVTGTAWIGLEQNFIDIASSCLCSHSGPTLQAILLQAVKK